MSVAKVLEISKTLYKIPKPTRWQRGIGAELPEAYKKFWKEWKLTQPEPVHFIPQKGTYIRNEETGEVKRVDNIPLPLLKPKEFHDGIWGGEAIVQGFYKPGPKQRKHRRVPHFWFPTLVKSVVYSEVLDCYMNITVTNRTLDLIHKNYGFDNYLLKTKACDLGSLLALKIKRKILIALADKTLYPNNEAKREEIYAKYSKFLNEYTREEIEWYGHSYDEACNKWVILKNENVEIRPLKKHFRAEMIEELKSGLFEDKPEEIEEQEQSSWISKFNPFAKS